MVRLVTYKCKRCGYKWIPRTQYPGACPNCHSPLWNTPVSKDQRKEDHEKKDKIRNALSVFAGLESVCKENHHEPLM